VRGVEMEFQKVGKLNNNITHEIVPLELADLFIFGRLDCLLGYILINKREIHQEYVEKLKQKLQTLVAEEHFENRDQDILMLTEKYDNLLDQQELVKLHMSFFIEILQITEEQFWRSASIQVPNYNFHRSAILLEYNQMLALAEIIGREEAIDLYKKHTDRYIIIHDTPLFEKIEDLETMRNRTIEFLERGTYGRVRIVSDIEDGRYIVRRENCEKIDTVPDLEDREFLYAISCHCDFQVLKLYNENFVLTRRCTLAEGAPYCDNVYHDMRIDKTLAHPSKEFIDGMWPLNESLRAS
jgi:hypothetical protein